jgi:hypothetical protein
MFCVLFLGHKYKKVVSVTTQFLNDIPRKYSEMKYIVKLFAF